MIELAEVKSEKLTLVDIDRSMAGIYVCTASNGIPSPAIKRIPIYVKCKDSNRLLYHLRDPQLTSDTRKNF